MFTHMLGTIPRTRLTSLSVEGIKGKKYMRFFPIWYGTITKMGLTLCNRG